MVRKHRKYSTLLWKLFAITMILVFFFLAYTAIDKHRSFLGLFLGLNAIIVVNSLITYYLPYPKDKKSKK